VHRADILTTFMCRLSRNLGASTPWNPKGLSRPVMGLLYHCQNNRFIPGITFLSTHGYATHSSIPSMKIIQQPHQYMDRLHPVPAACHICHQELKGSSHVFLRQDAFCLLWILLTLAHTELTHILTRPSNSPYTEGRTPCQLAESSQLTCWIRTTMRVSSPARCQHGHHWLFSRQTQLASCLDHNLWPSCPLPTSL
jgi:hypothetical protein